MRFRIGCFALALAILCTGCVNLPQKPQQPPPVPPGTAQTPKTYWNDEPISGPPQIILSNSQQRAYFFKANTLVGASVVSSGKQGFDTPPGTYKVIQKDANHVSNLYGDYVDAEGNIVKRNVDVTKDPKPEGTEFKGAPMRYFLRFTGGYGMHAGLLPGYRASHGCVRLPPAMAKHFFENVEIGTPVIVEE